jgi:hypothetical protein
MDRQLTLLQHSGDAAPDADWRLDEHTKEVGRQGLAAARQALAQARKRVAA